MNTAEDAEDAEDTEIIEKKPNTFWSAVGLSA
jgi:hypothetical protein